MIRRVTLGCTFSVLALLGFAGTAHSADSRIITTRGTLEVFHSDNFATGEANYDLRLRNRLGVTKIEASEEPAGFSAGPEQYGGQRVQIRGTKLDGKLVIGAGSVKVLSGKRQLASASVAPVRRTAVLLVNFRNNTSQPWSASEVRDTMFASSDSVAAYYLEQSYGKMTYAGDVFGWYTIGESDTPCNQDVWAASARSMAQAAKVKLRSYDQVVYIFPRAAACQWVGYATVPGSEAWLNGTINRQKIAHELGHNLGSAHASSALCQENGRWVPMGGLCTVGEYGDPFDPMGNGLHHMSAARKAAMGWLPAANVAVASSSGVYTIAAQESLASAPQLLSVPYGGGGYWLCIEYRKPFPLFDAFSPADPVVNGVTIRVCPPGGGPSFLLDADTASLGLLDSSLKPGNTFLISWLGISVTTTSAGGSTASVQVQRP